jgi:hypothetical protein
MQEATLQLQNGIKLFSFFTAVNRSYDYQTSTARYFLLLAILELNGISC